MKLWQLKNPKTNENIGDPQPLPENWGPIFGIAGVKDRLGDLSWVGITDRCWVEVEVPEPGIDIKKLVDDQIAYFLKESLEMVSPDNTSLTKAQWQAWMEYRKKLQEITLQVGYPHEIFWPTKPE